MGWEEARDRRGRIEEATATPPGTVATKVVLFDGGVNEAVTPLKLTAEAPSKFWPVIVTLLPGALLVGVKLVMRAGR